VAALQHSPFGQHSPHLLAFLQQLVPLQHSPLGQQLVFGAANVSDAKSASDAIALSIDFIVILLG